MQFGYGINKNLNLELLGELKSQNSQQIIDLQKIISVLKKTLDYLQQYHNSYSKKQTNFSKLILQKNDWLLDIENFYKKVSGITTSSQGFQNQLEFVRTTGDYEIWEQKC